MNQFPGLLDPPPDEKGDPETNLARRAKAAGISRKDYIKLRSGALRLTGRVLGWNSATYDQAFIALVLIAEDVWGERQ